MKIRSTSQKGAFTLVEIMIVVAIIGLLASIAIPNFVKARNTAQTQACITNLRQIEGAINAWALENKKQDNDTVTLDNLKGAGGAGSSYIKLDGKGEIPGCPAGGQYILTTVATPPSCSIPTHKLP
ncbi:MAG: type pilus assembly protein PilA [Verrucomicrobiota bacterium]